MNDFNLKKISNRLYNYNINDNNDLLTLATKLIDVANDDKIKLFKTDVLELCESILIDK